MLFLPVIAVGGAYYTLGPLFLIPDLEHGGLRLAAIAESYDMAEAAEWGEGSCGPHDKIKF